VSESVALLVIGCSARKTAGVSTGRAWDVYDGRLFQVLKKAFRVAGRPPGLDILIVSAKFGVIGESRRIVAYDYRRPATPNGVIAAWTAQLRRLTQGRPYRHVHINLGAAYRAALPDLARSFGAAEVTFAEGGIGRRNAATRAWVLALPRSTVSGGRARPSSRRSPGPGGTDTRPGTAR
jgi:hypothetical protein